MELDGTFFKRVSCKLKGFFSLFLFHFSLFLCFPFFLKHLPKGSVCRWDTLDDLIAVFPCNLFIITGGRSGKDPLREYGKYNNGRPYSKAITQNTSTHLTSQTTLAPKALSRDITSSLHKSTKILRNKQGIFFIDFLSISKWYFSVFHGARLFFLNSLAGLALGSITGRRSRKDPALLPQTWTGLEKTAEVEPTVVSPTRQVNEGSCPLIANLAILSL